MQFYTADESSRITYDTMKKNTAKTNDGKMKKKIMKFQNNVFVERLFWKRFMLTNLKSSHGACMFCTPHTLDHIIRRWLMMFMLM